jgi:predicted PurR-regulated permease PerM
MTTETAEPARRLTGAEIASYILAAVALLLVLKLKLLATLLGGLAVFELVEILARKLPFVRSRKGDTGKVIAVAILGSLVVGVLSLAIIGLIAFFQSDIGSLSTLMKQMADILESSREVLPPWLLAELPENSEELQNGAVDWMRDHAGELQLAGAEISRSLAHLLVGMIVGALLSFHQAHPSTSTQPLAQALTERAERLGLAFRRIVFAQVRISALNTLLTAIYLAMLLPILGVWLPLLKTLILVTFLAGLLPVIGNLISNTVIVIVSLSYNPGVAALSLLYLVVIHKLEYFVNARIVGGQIQARAWELLLAMLVLEAGFGITGVVAAPIYYAYLKAELTERQLI